MPDHTYEFVQLDVFTQTPLAGNPLAIFIDARGLNDGETQALAREMNLSETTFILPRDPATEAQKGKKVRIFTVAEELPLPAIQRSAPRFICMHRGLLPTQESRLRSRSI
jgi:PhzF family phenazine biosynthesis protein